MFFCNSSNLEMVAPFVGAWIEIFKINHDYILGMVAPFVGAWIEIWNGWRDKDIPNESLPSWERGLKSYKDELIIDGETVAPFVGAWIEIAQICIKCSDVSRRSLRGSVD